MKLFVSSLLACCLLANTALALSCARPNMARSFNWAAEQEEPYILAVGHVIPREKVINPNKKNTLTPKSYYVEAQFKGTFLGVDGFTNKRDLPVKVFVQCLASWCGGMPSSSVEMLAFIRLTPDGYVLNSGPCGGSYFDKPKKRELRMIEACARKGECGPREESKAERLR